MLQQLAMGAALTCSPFLLAWQEDEALRKLVEKRGARNWSVIAQVRVNNPPSPPPRVIFFCRCLPTPVHKTDKLDCPRMPSQQRFPTVRLSHSRHRHSIVTITTIPAPICHCVLRIFPRSYCVTFAPQALGRIPPHHPSSHPLSPLTTRRSWAGNRAGTVRAVDCGGSTSWTRT